MFDHLEFKRKLINRIMYLSVVLVLRRILTNDSLDAGKLGFESQLVK